LTPGFVSKRPSPPRTVSLLIPNLVPSWRKPPPTMLSMPCSTKLDSCPRISSSCSRYACSFLHQTLPLSPKSFTSMCLRQTVRSPLHPGNVSRSTTGETMQRPSQLLHKHLQTWRARTPLSFHVSLLAVTHSAYQVPSPSRPDSF